MDNLNTDALIYYLLFSVFVFYQQVHIRNFRGASQGFQTLLTFSALAGTITGLVFLGYYAVQVSIVGALIIFGAGLLSGVVGPILERIVGRYALSLIGFIAWPIFAYLMFMSL